MRGSPRTGATGGGGPAGLPRPTVVAINRSAAVAPSTFQVHLARLLVEGPGNTGAGQATVRSKAGESSWRSGSRSRRSRSWRVNVQAKGLVQRGVALAEGVDALDQLVQAVQIVGCKHLTLED